MVGSISDLLVAFIKLALSKLVGTLRSHITSIEKVDSPTVNYFPNVCNSMVVGTDQGDGQGAVMAFADLSTVM